jgi:hypothetical protein
MSMRSLHHLLLILGLSTAACSGDDPGDDAGMCEEASQAFRSFVEAHRSCVSGSECTIIGDCGSNPDFTAIRRDSAEEGRRLMQARCYGGSDGPLYSAACEEGQCVARTNGSYCGMAALPDAAADADAATDASPDAASDADADASTDGAADADTMDGATDA